MEKNDGKIRFLLEDDEVEDEVSEKVELKVDQNVEESISFQSQEENKLNEAKEIIDERLRGLKKLHKN